MLEVTYLKFDMQRGLCTIFNISTMHSIRMLKEKKNFKLKQQNIKVLKQDINNLLINVNLYKSNFPIKTHSLSK